MSLITDIAQKDYLLALYLHINTVHHYMMLYTHRNHSIEKSITQKRWHDLMTRFASGYIKRMKHTSIYLALITDF